MNEPHNLYLYTRVVLFFASSESTLEIRDCDRKTENTLRLFAVKFNLEHWYNSEAQVSMIRRPQQTSPSISKDKSDILESLKSGSGSWNELDNTPRVREAPGVSIGKAGGSFLPLSKETLPYQHPGLLQDQPTQIVQQSMMDYRASNPTPHGVPKTVGENMRALRLAGGACWRCKLLRKKVSSPKMSQILQDLIEFSVIQASRARLVQARSFGRFGNLSDVSEDLYAPKGSSYVRMLGASIRFPRTVISLLACLRMLQAE